MLEQQFKIVKKKVLSDIEEQYIEITTQRYLEIENEITSHEIQDLHEFEEKFTQFKNYYDVLIVSKYNRNMLQMDLTNKPSSMIYRLDFIRLQ